MGMNTVYYQNIVSSPIGPLGIFCNEKALLQVRLLPENTPLAKSNHAYANHVALELQHYFEDASYQMNVAIEFSGTTFQRKIWQSLTSIPLGEVKTYGQLAKEYRSGPRAIGQACRTNNLLIVIPCHRVVAKQGLGGFGGTDVAKKWLDVKTWLLKHEGVDADSL